MSKIGVRRPRRWGHIAVWVLGISWVLGLAAIAWVPGFRERAAGPFAAASVLLAGAAVASWRPPTPAPSQPSLPASRWQAFYAWLVLVALGGAVWAARTTTAVLLGPHLESPVEMWIDRIGFSFLGVGLLLAAVPLLLPSKPTRIDEERGEP